MTTHSPVALAYRVELSYDVSSDTADFIFNVQASSTAQQRVVHETLGVTQNVPLQEYVDPVTHARLLRLRANPGPLTLRYDATVEIDHYRATPSSIDEIPVVSLPTNVLPFLNPSRYCESDKLGSFAMAQFGSMPPGYARIQAICDWVSEHVAFVSGSSSGTTSALETVVQRQGVCRDFAHLMIALCRALSIPARFTTGFDYGADPALGPPDFHAYVEVYAGGRWFMFDPSGTAIPMGFVRLSTGRDAADSAFASMFGDVVATGQVLTIQAVPASDGVLREPVRGSDALSTDAGL